MDIRLLSLVSFLFSLKLTKKDHLTPGGGIREFTISKSPSGGFRGTRPLWGMGGLKDWGEIEL
jgi:hypothetical protein